MLAAVGGILGVLFMMPLRRALIVKEHGKLPYPEGTACADVLIAGERGGNLAKMVFAGVGIGARSTSSSTASSASGTRPRPGSAPSATACFPNATLHSDITPEYLGVGYIIGPRIAGELVRRRRARRGWC